MKKMELLIFIVILGTCGFGFGLPFMITGTSAQKVYDSDLLIPNTGGGTATATRSTERALTIQAVSTLFNTATNTSVSADLLAPTNTLGATSTLTLESLPSVTLTSLTIEPTITRRPRERPTDTPIPPTRTVVAPTNTRLPSPTTTNPPPPTITKPPTKLPTLTKTPVPPTNTQPPPTATEVPPTDPPPTNTPQPPATEVPPTQPTEPPVDTPTEP